MWACKHTGYWCTRWVSSSPHCCINPQHLALLSYVPPLLCSWARATPPSHYPITHIHYGWFYICHKVEIFVILGVEGSLLFHQQCHQIFVKRILLGIIFFSAVFSLIEYLSVKAADRFCCRVSFSWVLLDYLELILCLSVWYVCLEAFKLKPLQSSFSSEPLVGFLRQASSLNS